MLVVIDLDELKLKNDAKGHAFRDQYLINAACTLKMLLRDIDIVARLGGDEFGIIIRNIPKKEALEKYKTVQAALLDAGIQASVGHAIRLSCRTLQKL